jgi:predicted nucleic acid-binding protein
MPRYALIDTGAIFALANRKDKHHAAAQKVFREWTTQRNGWIVLDWVFIESMTLLKARLDATVTLRFGQQLRRNPLYRWVRIQSDDELEIWNVFQKYSDKEWSYTDCGLFVMAQRLRTAEVFTFDEHFKQMPGIVRLP